MILIAPQHVANDSWIQTRTGIAFPLLSAEPSDVHLQDIAHALSNLCRFTGHVTSFYSVAQHSVHVSHLVPPEYALAGLMHDATEAYLGDVSTPLKTLLPTYTAIEHNLERVIAQAFGLPWPAPAAQRTAIRQADLVALATERRDLLLPGPTWAPSLEAIRPDPECIEPASPREAYALFVLRYHDIIHRHHEEELP